MFDLGPPNVAKAAPEPVTNAVFSRALAGALHRPAVLPAVPAALLTAVAGDLGRELLIGGQRVLPKAALASGFAFTHPTLAGALAAILGNRPHG